MEGPSTNAQERGVDVKWHHCCSLDDWLCLQVEPLLLHAEGTNASHCLAKFW